MDGNRSMRKGRGAIWLHVLFWVALGCVSSASSIVVLRHLHRGLYVLGSVVQAAFLCYGLAAIRAFAERRRPPKATVVALVFLVLVLEYLSGWLIFRSWEVLLSVYYVLRHIAGSVFVLALFFSMEYQIRQFRKREEIGLLERRLLKAEVQALRNLVSPHFLLNGLNNVHSLIHLGDPRAAEYVLQLGDLMRYVLEESDSDEVDLQRELDFVGRYVALQKIKMGEVDVRLLLEPVPRALRLPPMLLIHLVENCFKHGNTHCDPDAWIEIRCRMEADRLVFETENTIAFDKRIGEEHVGLSSARAMLAYFRPDGHSLVAQRRAGSFATRLECEFAT